MKKFTVFLLFVTLSFTVFCHEAQKQTERLMPEGLTQKWLECELAADRGAVESSEYQARLQAFALEVKKAEPSDTVIYYFPEAKLIYENLLEGINKGDNQKIAENVRSWEILQKNLAKFQLEQFYYSYRILIFVIIK